MIISKSNNKIQNLILWMIWAFFCYLLFMVNLFGGLFLFALIIFLYFKLVYKVLFHVDYIEIKYLNKSITVNHQDILYIEIAKVRPSIDLNLSLVTRRGKKKRYNFSYGDTENLVSMLNYFKEKKIKIFDERHLLDSIVKFENNSYKKKTVM